MYNKEKVYHLYWIHRDCHTSMKTQGYVGISCNTTNRFQTHRRDARQGKGLAIHNAIRKYDDINFTVICTGPFDYILDLEEKLRPTRRIGWNIAIGGDKTGLCHKMSDELVMFHAKLHSKLERIDVLNLWIDYFEKDINSYKLAEKYNISRVGASRYIRGATKIFEDIEYIRLAIRSGQKSSQSRRKSISEEVYNKILIQRESGMFFTHIAKEFGVSERSIRALCYGEYEYIKEFPSYRVVK